MPKMGYGYYSKNCSTLQHSSLTQKNRTMKNLFYLLLSSICLLVISCNTSRSVTARTMPIESTVKSHPTMCDLIVKDQKVSATEVVKNKKLTDNMRNSVIAKALADAQADILIEPNFVIVTKGSKTTVTVTGFPGVYKNFIIQK